MREAVTVRESKHPRYTHVVRYPGENGKRLVKWFTNETEALEEVNSLRKEFGETGAAFGNMMEEERTALALWRSFVNEADTKPPALVEVVREFRDRWKASRCGVTVAKAFDAFTMAKEAEGVGASYVQTLGAQVGRFAKEWGGRPIGSITTTEVSDWILGLHGARSIAKGKPKPLGLQTKKNFRVSLHGFFAFCRSRGWIELNPVTDAAKPKPKRKPPVIMKAGDIAEFFAALEAKAPEVVPFWAVKFFAGIRDAESTRADWSMFDLEAGEIHLPVSVTKTGQPRTVVIVPALAAFLKTMAKRSGPLVPYRDGRFSSMALRYATDKALKELRKPAEGESKPRKFELPHNAGRHAFATYHLLAFRHAGETSLQLGHGGSPEMLHQHYKGLAIVTDAEAFWAIRPAGDGGNVVAGKFAKRKESKATSSPEARKVGQ